MHGGKICDECSANNSYVPQSPKWERGDHVMFVQSRVTAKKENFSAFSESKS